MNIFPNRSFRCSEAALAACIGRLLAGPRWLQKEFVIGRTTYAALYAMAAHLRANLGRDTDGPPVCLCAQDKAVMAAALLAALVGGPALVVPYAFTPPVLDELRHLTGFRTIVSDIPRPVPAGVRCIQPAAGAEHWPSTEALVARTSDSQWVRLFTGGSTSAPRMWTKTVRNLLVETVSIVANYDVTPEERVVATVSPNHIYGLLYAVLSPLLASAAVAAQTPSFPAEIETVVRDTDASILISVPAHYRALNGRSFAPRSLRLACSSAGMLAAEDATAFSALTGVGITEIYGSTETGGIAARVRAEGQNDYRPFAGIDVKIEAERLKVRSDYLSPELALDEEGYFMVGDRVQATVGNRFELLGRVDGIVKVGGRRVDLEAVRQTLKRQPGITDALAISLPVGRGRENQVVAVVEGNPAAVNLTSLRLDELETCARPRSIKVVEKIPVTAAGKYDRKTIEALFRSGGRGQGATEALAGPLGEKGETPL
jgi:acyl-coenzyme A synthetase/AMP-(fatty) acid ligase